MDTPIEQTLAMTRNALQFEYPAVSTGQYGQSCVPPDASFTCMSVNAGVTDMGTGKVECGVAFGCCLCGTIRCGTPETPCDGLIAGAAQSVYGVQRIVILGEEGAAGAVIDCGGTYILSIFLFALHVFGWNIDQNI